MMPVSMAAPMCRGARTRVHAYARGRVASPLLAALLLVCALPAVQAFAGAPVTQAAALTAPAASSTAQADGDHLRLRWELLRNVFDDRSPDGRTLARLALTNRDTRPLPTQGWSLYLNFMERIDTGPLPAGLVLEQVADSLFRLRPGPGFAGLAPGATLDIDFAYPGLVIKLATAPAGPYLVYDAAPDTGMAIADFALLPVTRPEQLDRGASAKKLVTPADTYLRNTRADTLPADALPPVIPTPLSFTRGPGRLALTGRLTVDAPATLQAEADFARTLFAQGAGAGASAGGPRLRLSIGAVLGQSSPESYALTVRPGGIDIVGASAAGVFYGLQSLRDLMPLPGATDSSLPQIAIVDAPRFDYRGFQLDVARNFHDKRVVFKWLDLMARYKLNRFHFHLTDDEGWRLEIAGLPELTAVGAVRGHSARPGVRLQPAYGSGPDPRDPHGSGFYTRADFVEILRYAKARHIDVIPEIEMPGHARAARVAMRARTTRLHAAGDKHADAFLLDDANDRSRYRSPQMVTDGVIDPGLDSTYAFVDHVVTQIAALYREAGAPLHTIHMGGDELAAGAWAGSPASQARMRQAHLESTADLWDYFYGRVDGILKKHGLTTSGWEELAARQTRLHGKPKLIPNPLFTQRGFTAWVWNNTPGAEDFAYRLANAGYDIVLAPVAPFYMDMAANANPDEPGVDWGGTTELDTVYDFIPFDMQKNAPDAARIGKDGLTDDGRRRVRGLEATLFTETVRDPARIDYLVMPRLLALAERAWAPDPAWATEADPAKAAVLHRVAWSGFVNALGRRVLPRLDLDDAGVDYRIAPPGLLVQGDRVLVNHALPGLTLRYTVDGSVPDAGSRVVMGPIAEAGTIRVAAFDRNGRMGAVASVERR